MARAVLGAEHERELQGPELGQEGGGPVPAEAVRDLQGDKEKKSGGGLPCWSSS